MTRQYRKYTDEDIKFHVPEVINLTQLLSALGLKPIGGNFNQMKKRLQLLNIDCSHWTGQAWNTGQQLKDWTEYSRSTTLRPHLIRVRGHKCECCNLTTWLDKPIKLEIHHVDGDRTNNEEINLQLLCPNCHSVTPNWKGSKEKSNRKDYLCPDCGGKMSDKSTRCMKCFHKPK